MQFKAICNDIFMPYSFYASGIIVRHDHHYRDHPLDKITLSIENLQIPYIVKDGYVILIISYL